MTTSNIFSKLLRPFSSATARSSLTPDTPQQSLPANTKLCTLAAGCFWGVEHRFRHEFQGKGLHQARVGYIGGDTDNPSYRSVCSGRTGHAEALQLAYDPDQINYRHLIEYFYRMHDPTTANRQGPDVGSQYRSGIFYHDEEQAEIAKDVTKKVQEQWYKDGKVETQVLSAGQWWDAEDYHQRYLEVNPSGYDCPSHFVRKFPPLS